MIGRFPRILGHLSSTSILQILGIVVMRRDLNEPRVLNLNNLPHILLSSKDKLMINNPPGQRLKETRIGVYMNSLLMLSGFVGAGFAQFGRVIEEAGRDGLSNRHRVVDALDEFDLDALTQPGELIANVASSFHRAVLNEVLVAPLRREVRVFPLFVDVEEG